MSRPAPHTCSGRCAEDCGSGTLAVLPDREQPSRPCRERFARPGVPERLRRPGAVVVELDDEDPDFADLPYATYEFPEEDIRRAAGQ